MQQKKTAEFSAREAGSARARFSVGFRRDVSLSFGVAVRSRAPEQASGF